MVELWAKDDNKGSYSSCGFHPLKFSFSKNVAETSKTFTCANVGSNKVQMWVTDSKGGQEYCEVEVIIQNNGANIPDCKPKPVTPVDPVYSQKGNFLTLTDTPLHNAEITLKYKDPIIKYTSTFDTTETLELDSFINLSGHKLYRYITVKKITETKDSTLQFITKKVKTNLEGKYLLDSLALKGKALELSATYKDDARKNIDNKDVELLTKFLLGDVTFSSYHQYLASDEDAGREAGRSGRDGNPSDRAGRRARRQQRGRHRDSARLAPIHWLADSAAEPLEVLEAAQNVRLQEDGLHSALASLDDRSRTIVQRRWLAQDSEAATLHQLAAEYGVSAERIRQIEANAMKKIRALFQA